VYERAGDLPAIVSYTLLFPVTAAFMLAAPLHLPGDMLAMSMFACGAACGMLVAVASIVYLRVIAALG
jgi:hypothetical protein